MHEVAEAKRSTVGVYPADRHEARRWAIEAEIFLHAARRRTDLEAAGWLGTRRVRQHALHRRALSLGPRGDGRCQRGHPFAPLAFRVQFGRGRDGIEVRQARLVSS